MKKLFIFVALLSLNTSIFTNDELWEVDENTLDPKPTGKINVYYNPAKVEVKQTAILANQSNPIPISITPRGSLPIKIDQTVPVSLPRNYSLPVTLDQTVPVSLPRNYSLPVTLDQTIPIALPTDYSLPVTFDENKNLPITINEDVISQIIESVIEKLNECAEAKAPELKETGQTIVGTFLNAENAVRFGLPIAAFGVIALSGFYGSRVAWKVIEKNLLSPKPRILQPGSKYGWYDRWQRNRKGYKTPAMIFDELIKDRLEEIQAKTTSIRSNIRKGRKLTYDNLLLYGKPGTGKTLFAQILADYTDMDFLCVTAASLLQSGVEGIKYFDEILEMAEKSKYGVILFIDEADALFVNRDMLQPDSDHYKVLNHILAATGSGSSKIMIIAATNYAFVMDPAMGRRFQERVKMPLPSEKTREDLLQLYINQYLCDEISAGLTQAKKARSLFTSQRINEIAQETAGLSHAEIKDMIVIMAKKAGTSINGILTEKHITSSIAQAVEKKSALKKDKEKLKKKNNQNEH